MAFRTQMRTVENAPNAIDEVCFRRGDDANGFVVYREFEKQRPRKVNRIGLGNGWKYIVSGYVILGGQMDLAEVALANRVCGLILGGGKRRQ
jgi:hypothetical protein